MPYKAKQRAEREKVVRSILVKDEDIQKIKAIATKSKFVTPNALANQLGIRVSVVKDILENLEKEGIIKQYDVSKRLKIYVPVKSTKKKK
ncbi:MAG: winged helix-turn-helix transcriptional regulator [Candidatus Asgardarchaeia archaeon]